ncbi:MAG: SEC-C metal-binding domain-containing protein [Bacillota bacterium]
MKDYPGLLWTEMRDRQAGARGIRPVQGPLLKNPSGQSPAKAEKVGSNQPCPCGSGRKFKRCCGRDGAGLTSRPAGGTKPGRMLLATHGYASRDYLANCPEDDPVLFLEKKVENRGDGS